MIQEMDLFDKLYAAYVRAFVEHDPSWLTANAWVAGGILVVVGVLVHDRLERWHEKRLANIRPEPSAAEQLRARRWFTGGSWASFLLLLVIFVLAHNWP